MKVREGRTLTGPAGTATEILIELGRGDPRDWTATVANWFLRCPAQSPAWDCYAMSIIHLRAIDDVAAAKLRFPGATHELLLFAIDPQSKPNPLNVKRWRRLRPVNVVEQVVLFSDEDARELARLCAHAVVLGALPAEPALSGQVEPWRTSLIKTAAHLRGEEHAP